MTLIVVAAQASLIVGLLIERQRRRRAQAGLSERLDFETLVASISATFAGLPTGRVDEHIRDCLRRIVLFIGADRGTLWQPSADGQVLSATHSWTAEGANPPPATITISAFQSLRPLSQHTRPASFASLDDLPPAALVERHLFERLGVKSFLALPLRIGDRTLGTLVFSSLRVERSWPSELVQRLQTLAELFANALMRRQEATALEVSEALTASVLATLPGEAAIVDVSGTIVQVNDAWAASLRADDARPLAACPWARTISTRADAASRPPMRARRRRSTWSSPCCTGAATRVWSTMPGETVRIAGSRCACSISSARREARPSCTSTSAPGSGPRPKRDATWTRSRTWTAWPPWGSWPPPSLTS